ncbi:MAG: glycoside hydrolase family 3 protein [Olsenella sp.]|nr:glycoside hydrolase family 3 protein [Olsenella sp.]
MLFNRVASRPLAVAQRALLAAALVCGTAMPTNAAVAREGDGREVAPQANSKSVDEILAGMSLDEKISQMIIPAIRTWDDAEVTDLSAAPELASALQKHQYGGIILFGQNVKGTEQTARLVSDLQANNAKINASTKIPYLMPVDEEGGVVTRLSMGTRMTGSMAVGATGESAETNAEKTGEVIGEELAALGFNVDFAPDADVNNNPLNPVIGTRSFSDDPSAVATLAGAFSSGLAKSNVIATYKHFPGHGDTGSDTHTGTAAVDKTIDELRKTELVPFKAAVDGGADLIMTAHITLPKYDDEVTFADGTKGYYPATMSKKVMGNLLRGELGYKGVIVTDALEMGAVAGGALVPGAAGSVEYAANVAEKVINAGVDILLIPTDLKNADAASFYDGYINAIANKVGSGTISEARINESVRRILELKRKYGVLDTDTSGANIDQVVAKAKQVVGSDEHHATEMEIARQAVTLVKNDASTLPVSGAKGDYVLLAYQKGDDVALDYAVRDLQEKGVVPSDAKVTNLVTGASRGSDDSAVKVTIDYYYDTSDPKNPVTHYTDELAEAIAGADATVVLTKTRNVGMLQDGSPIHQGIQRAIDDAHAAGGKAVLLSSNLPYDAARYQGADAIMLAYMSSGVDVDPTDRGTGNVGAFNANVVAAVESMFGSVPPTGTLPVNVPSMVKGEDGKYAFDVDSPLYQRGFGLRYESPEPECAEMYRLYNPYTGEHFYTASAYERDVNVGLGWNDEGVGWVAPVEGAPVFRVYNPYAGDHHYTMSEAERDYLVSVGWNDEGVGWSSAGEDGVPLWRQYNPNAVAGAHNYTTSEAERDYLVSVGWHHEGIGWYAVS